MLERRSALGTEDVAGTDARATHRAALIIGHALRRGDWPRRSRLGPGHRVVASGAPGRPYCLIVLRLGRIQGLLTGALDLVRPAVAVVHNRGLSVSRPGLRLRVRRSNRERRGCLDPLAEAAGTRDSLRPRLILTNVAIVGHPQRTLPRRHGAYLRSVALPWLAPG